MKMKHQCNCSVNQQFTFLSIDRARDTKSDEIVALKKVRMDKEKDGEISVFTDHHYT